MIKVIVGAATIAGLIALLAVAFGVVATIASASNGPYQIKIDNFNFVPATLTVTAGATVTWINQDDVPHTVASKDGKDFKSSVLDTDQKFTHTFARAGTYEYYCTIHPKMIGKVVVQ